MTAANLLANATGGGLAVLLTKPLLMPLLAAYLWRASAERAARPDRLAARRAGLHHRRRRRPA